MRWYVTRAERYESGPSEGWNRAKEALGQTPRGDTELKIQKQIGAQSEGGRRDKVVSFELVQYDDIG